ADVVVVTAPLLTGAADEDQHAALHAAREDASVNAILHTSYPVRHWDHDLGPARPALFTVDEEQTPTASRPRTGDELPRRLRHVTEGLG
ncbi:hypothetical protein ACP3WF_23840, partial [Salmonella enterica]